jgi:hypothetical protein
VAWPQKPLLQCWLVLVSSIDARALRRAITSKSLSNAASPRINTVSKSCDGARVQSCLLHAALQETALQPAYSMQFTWCMIDQHQPCALGAAVLRCACAGPASRAVTASRTLAQGNGCLSANAAMFCSSTCLMHSQELPPSAGLAFANVTSPTNSMLDQHDRVTCRGTLPAAEACTLPLPSKKTY